MSDKDLYAILGVGKGASADDIKKAYKRLAMKLHPDRNKSPGAEDRFKKIQQAYSILSNSEKRDIYDRHGTVDHPGNPFGFRGFSDIFDDFTNFFQESGTSFEQTQNDKGNDLRVTIELSLEEAVYGCERKLTINAPKGCGECAGTGAKDAAAAKCDNCDGTGAVHRRIAFLIVQETCRECAGTGQVIKDPCDACNGSGRIHEKKKVTVKIPAGVDNGDRLRIQGQGEAGRLGSDAGDLLVDVSVRHHQVFEREGNNLHCAMPISFATAALGGKAEVPTLGGSKQVELPKGIQSGKILKIRGAGIKEGLRSRVPGDLFCVVKVETPRNLNDEQIKLIKKLDSSLRKNPARHSPDSTGWLDRVKKLFGGND